MDHRDGHDYVRGHWAKKPGGEGWVWKPAHWRKSREREDGQRGGATRKSLIDAFSYGTEFHNGNLPPPPNPKEAIYESVGRDMVVAAKAARACQRESLDRSRSYMDARPTFRMEVANSTLDGALTTLGITTATVAGSAGAVSPTLAAVVVAVPFMASYLSMPFAARHNDEQGSVLNPVRRFFGRPPKDPKPMGIFRKPINTPEGGHFLLVGGATAASVTVGWITKGAVDTPTLLAAVFGAVGAVAPAAITYDDRRKSPIDGLDVPRGPVVGGLKRFRNFYRKKFVVPTVAGAAAAVFGTVTVSPGMAAAGIFAAGLGLLIGRRQQRIYDKREGEQPRALAPTFTMPAAPPPPGSDARAA